MNEAQIIRAQLALERRNFSAVASACTQALESRQLVAAGGFARACGEYFEFAVARFNSPQAAALLDGLTAIRRGDADNAPQWRTFLAAFNATVAEHFEQLEAQLSPLQSIAKLRSLARIDADSIVSEHQLFVACKQTLPAGVTLPGSGAASTA